MKRRNKAKLMLSQETIRNLDDAELRHTTGGAVLLHWW